jgi:hypothetical protein
MADRLCGGSLTPLLMNLLRAKPLADHEFQELQKLVKELGQQNRRKGDKPASGGVGRPAPNAGPAPNA